MKKSLSMILGVIVALGIVFPAVAESNQVSDKIVIDGLRVEVYEKRTEEKKSKIGDTTTFVTKEWYVLSEAYDLPTEAKDFSEEEKFRLVKGGRVKLYSDVKIKDPWLGFVNIGVKNVYLSKDNLEPKVTYFTPSFILMFLFFTVSVVLIYLAKNKKEEDLAVNAVFLSSIAFLAGIIIFCIFSRTLPFIISVALTIFAVSLLTKISSLRVSPESQKRKILLVFGFYSLGFFGVLSFFDLKISELFIVTLVAQIFGLLTGILIKKVRDNKNKKAEEEDFAMT